MYIPKEGINDYHRLNFALLMKYIHVFNGERIFLIANDSNKNISDFIFTENLISDTLKIFIQQVKNDPVNWEAKHFLTALEMVKSGYTFYAHCKGVTRPPMTGLKTWINHLYNENLKTPPDLEKKIFSGICAKLLPCPPYVPSPWHYSGSFYWFNTIKVKNRIKKLSLKTNRYYTESLPGSIATPDECILDFYCTRFNENFYHQATWDNIHKYLEVPTTKI